MTNKSCSDPRFASKDNQCFKYFCFWHLWSFMLHCCPDFNQILRKWQCLPKSAVLLACRSYKPFSLWSQCRLCSQRLEWKCHRHIWRGRRFYPRCCCQWLGVWTCNQNFGPKHLCFCIGHLLLKPSKKGTTTWGKFQKVQCLLPGAQHLVLS